MRWVRTLSALAIVGCASVALAETADVQADLAAIRRVDRLGKGHEQAAAAVTKLSQLGPDKLPELLAGMNGANPLATNWLRGVVDAVADRTVRSGGKLPQEALEAFLRDQANAPRARRLAFEWLLAVEPQAGERLIPQMLDDSSVELRREAVVWAIGQAEKAEQDMAPAADVLAAYQRAFVASRDIDQIKKLAEKLEKLGAKPDLPKHMGFITGWRLIGPFDNSGKKGFPIAYPPEVEEFSADAEYTGKADRKLRWTEHTTTDAYGMVDLNKALGKEPGAIAYARVEIDAPEARPAELRLGCINASKVWLNGQPVNAHDVYHSGNDIDQYVDAVTLKQGKNVILLKVAQNEQTEDWAQDWAFQLRVCDAVGTAVIPPAVAASTPDASSGR
jgi:hypothetical protein